MYIDIYTNILNLHIHIYIKNKKTKKPCVRIFAYIYIYIFIRKGKEYQDLSTIKHTKHT